ncbi:MAG: hypothetical protein E7567_07745 [Ruminococcaceae bacterium]|nr:hypothetical protein [Oscillospiraceae bacterium]
MNRTRKWLAILLALAMVMAMCLAGCQKNETTDNSAKEVVTYEKTEAQKAIETALDLSNMDEQEWTYDKDADAWTLSVVTAVTNPEIEDEQGVSVCVPGAYVTGIDTDKDGEADVTADTADDAVRGSLVIDTKAKVTSTNGQVYTAKTAPVIVNTGAAGYSEQENQTAATTYAKEGYINVACGNRGKQSSIENDDGTTTYTGDAPSCLVDQKNAVRFVKYNILLGNLPGSVDYFVSTGGSGGGAHAAMIAATSNNPDFYDYEIEAGAVGVYKTEDGNYFTTVTIDGKEVELSDGMWGCMAYSAITSLAEADMAQAFEYYLDEDYDFNTNFQAKMAEYLSEEYMEYINGQKLTMDESKVGFDLNEDGDTKDTVDLTIEYDADKYKDTNGYGGTYLNYYLATMEKSLEAYLDRLDYAEDWTWFGDDGSKLSDEEVAAMTSADKAKAFVEGRYAKGSTGSGSDKGGMPGGMTGGMGQMDGNGPPSGGMPSGNGGPGGSSSSSSGKTARAGNSLNENGEEVGTPESGSTQSSSSKTDSSNYSTYAELLEAYKEDVAEVTAGDEYGKNIVELYDPTNYIGEEDTDAPTWTRILCGAAEGDISMFNSMNMQIAWLNSGTDAAIEWQWDGGHVPSEILGDSLALYVDTMYGKYVDGAVQIAKEKAETVTKNGDATEASGTDLSDWVTYKDGEVDFTLADAAAYRAKGASKAVPGFDVIDYGQEDYVFGNSEKDARHWDQHVLDVLEEHADDLTSLFNQG